MPATGAIAVPCDRVPGRLEFGRLATRTLEQPVLADCMDHQVMVVQFRSRAADVAVPSHADAFDLLVTHGSKRVAMYFSGDPPLLSGYSLDRDGREPVWE